MTSNVGLVVNQIGVGSNKGRESNNVPCDGGQAKFYSPQTFLERYNKTALQHFPKQLKWMGTRFKMYKI